MKIVVIRLVAIFLLIMIMVIDRKVADGDKL